MAIRVLIANDHSVVRQGLRMFLGTDTRRLGATSRTSPKAPTLLRASFSRATSSGVTGGGLSVVPLGLWDRSTDWRMGLLAFALQ